MNIHAVPLPEAAQTTVTPALSAVLTRLRALIADRLYRTAFLPLILPLWSYLKRVERRFARLAIRHAAGVSGTPRPAKPRPPRPREAGAPARAAPLPFPRKPAWFLACLKHEAAYIRTRMEAFLAEPETAALIIACPRAAGTLRYVFLMLGMPDPRPRQKRPRPKPAAPPAPPRPRRDAAPIDPRASGLSPRPTPEPCPRAAARWSFLGLGPLHTEPA